MALVVLTAVYLALMFGGTEPTALELTTFRNVVLYSYIAVFMAYTFDDRREIDALTNLVLVLAGISSVFGILQAVLGNRLPLWLLRPRDAEVFGYFGTDITRSNGLIGNTIVFATYLTLMIALTFAKYMVRPQKRLIVLGVILLAAVYTTFSRAAIVGAAVVVALTFVLSRRDVLRAAVRLVAILIATSAVAFAIYAIPAARLAAANSFLYQQLFLGNNASVQGSNAGHALDIALGVQQFNQSPAIGVGLGSQSQISTLSDFGISITDGAFWSRLAETGLLGMGAHIAVALTTIVFAWRLWRSSRRTNYLALAYISYASYEFAVAAFVNSGYYGKTPFVLAWAFFGLAVATGRTETTEGDSPGRGRSQFPERSDVKSELDRLDA